MKRPLRSWGFVQRPSVTFFLAYAGLWIGRFMWILCTAEAPAAGPIQLIGLPELLAFSAVHAIWLGVLVLEGRNCIGQVPARRGELVGVVLAALVVVLFQLGAMLAH